MKSFNINDSKNNNNKNNDDKEKNSHHQFICNICGAGFEQKSRIDRHMFTSHPEPAPSAADVEKTLGGIKYPKEKKDLVKYARDKVLHSPDNQELLELIENLPERTYRDSAEVAKALGDLKSGKKITIKKDSKYEEQPGKKGGRTASTYSLSAASIAKFLSGIDLPKNKKELIEYVKEKDRHDTQQKEIDIQQIIQILDKIKSTDYHDMAQIEKQVGKVM